LNVGQTLLTASIPRKVSPNPNAPLDHTLDPIMTVGSGLLEGLSRDGLPRSVRGRLYDLIGWTMVRCVKSRVLCPN
jgi:hypothetical protein